MRVTHSLDPFNAAGPMTVDPFDLDEPDDLRAPVLFASPHSGRHYPQDLRDKLDVPVMDLRRIEDAYVDELFSDVPTYGACFLKAGYARAYVDLNRDARELDPAMFSDGVPRACGSASARVEAGLGCFPRITARGEPIYARLLERAEGERRLSGIHDLYHAALQQKLQSFHDDKSVAFLVDCHSMPSTQPGRSALPDIVLGDRFGSSCDTRVTGLLERTFRSHGLSVVRNAPYAGGYTTRRYGRPRRGFHAIQIEINRSLYMDEATLERNNGFTGLRDTLNLVARAVIEFAAHAQR